jgi:hypothetical protein
LEWAVANIDWSINAQDICTSQEFGIHVSPEGQHTLLCSFKGATFCFQASLTSSENIFQHMMGMWSWYVNSGPSDTVFQLLWSM